LELAELTEDQRRRFVDARQAFEAWREADQEFRHGYRGSMRWKPVGGKDHLYRTFNQVANYLGPRSPETEKIKEDYTEQRTRLRRRLTMLGNRLKGMDRLNRASDLGRMPETAARILRKLDAEGLLGKHLFVVGTHSLYAYEAASGVLFDTGLTATGDIDLRWDVRRKLSLALVDARQEGVLGLLRRVDRSFTAKRGSYRAINDDGYYVDLIRPLEKDEVRKAVNKLTDVDDDLEAAAIIGLNWLINAPKFEQVVIGADGRPLWMSCIDPRAFALHKFWLSREPSRDAVKRRRDAQQARAVASVAAEYLGLRFEAKDLTALPIELVKGAKELARSASARTRSQKS
jgi:hypothetical protein